MTPRQTHTHIHTPDRKRRAYRTGSTNISGGLDVTVPDVRNVSLAAFVRGENVSERDIITRWRLPGTEVSIRSSYQSVVANVCVCVCDICRDDVFVIAQSRNRINFPTTDSRGEKQTFGLKTPPKRTADKRRRSRVSRVNTKREFRRFSFGARCRHGKPTGIAIARRFTG